MFKLGKIDYIIIFITIIVVILSFILIYRVSDNNIIVIYAGDKKKVFSLQDSCFEVRSNWGFVKVLVKDKKVRIIDSSCSDKICIGMGWISMPGESLVCVPSHIFIEIKRGKNEKNKEFDTITR